MVYNEEMDKKLIELTLKWKNVTKKKMFGGTGYLLNGNMIAGVYQDFYLLRLGEEQAEEAIKNRKIKLMDINRRKMKGWIMAPLDAFKDDTEFNLWLQKAKNYIEKFPPK